MPLASARTILVKWGGDKRFVLDIAQLNFLALSQTVMGTASKTAIFAGSFCSEGLR